MNLSYLTDFTVYIYCDFTISCAPSMKKTCKKAK